MSIFYSRGIIRVILYTSVRMTLGKCMKLLFMFLNTMLGIAGVSETILMSMITFWMSTYRIFLPLKLFFPLYLIIILNTLNLSAVYKVFSAIQHEKTLFIKTLCGSLIVKSILEVGIGIYCFLLRDNLDIIDIMRKSFQKYLTKSYEKEQWDYIQNQLTCCGTTGPRSFIENSVDFTPISCCNSTSESTSQSRTCESGLYINGCVDALTSYTRHLLLLTALVIFIFIVIQIIGMSILSTLNIRLVKIRYLKLLPMTKATPANKQYLKQFKRKSKQISTLNTDSFTCV